VEPKITSAAEALETPSETRYKSAFDLVALSLAGGVTVLTSEGSFDPYDVMIGVVLLILLSTRDTGAMAVRAYSAVWALLWIVTLGFPMDILLLGMSQAGLRDVFESLGGQLRRIGYLPTVDPVGNDDWLAAYGLCFTMIGFSMWYCLAAFMAKHRGHTHVILWWRA
jgi:hypothetical protein